MGRGEAGLGQPTHLGSSKCAVHKTRRNCSQHLDPQHSLVSAGLPQQTLEHVSRRRAAFCAARRAETAHLLAHSLAAAQRPSAPASGRTALQSRASDRAATRHRAAAPKTNTKNTRAGKGRGTPRAAPKPKQAPPAVRSRVRNNVQDEPLHAMVLVRRRRPLLGLGPGPGLHRGTRHVRRERSGPRRGLGRPHLRRGPPAPPQTALEEAEGAASAHFAARPAHDEQRRREHGQPPIATGGVDTGQHPAPLPYGFDLYQYRSYSDSDEPVQVAPHLRRRRDWAVPQRALREPAAPLLPGGRGRLLLSAKNETEPGRRHLRRERRGQDGDDEVDAPLPRRRVETPKRQRRQAQGHDAIYGSDDRRAHGRVEPPARGLRQRQDAAERQLFKIRQVYALRL
mmetsp:Transcript_16461/g.46763  ORF Transcript_16461/g.46763 Transcript_16461/m.46763 type:complete len:397 (+) Transcript_16461:1394-2584(+)